MIRLNWADASEDYAVCLCRAGRLLRAENNVRRPVVPLWHVWCARERVDMSRVVFIEDVLTPAELSERGLHTAEQETSREAALLAASRKAKR